MQYNVSVVMMTMMMIVTISRIAMTTGAPRLAKGAEEMPLEINLSTITNLTFYLESSPPPSTFTFNRDFNGVFNVVCSNTAMRSRHACVITVTIVTEAEEGVHVLDIGNAIGHTLVRFNVSRGSEYRHAFVFDFFRLNLLPSLLLKWGKRSTTILPLLLLSDFSLLLFQCYYHNYGDDNYYNSG